MQSERLQNCFGIGGHAFVLPPRALGRRVLHDFDLLELMLTDQAARVLAVRTRLTSKTRRIGGVETRKTRCVEDLVAVDVRDRHFGWRDELQIALGELEEILFEFRKLTRGAERI